MTLKSPSLRFPGRTIFFVVLFTLWLTLFPQHTLFAQEDDGLFLTDTERILAQLYEQVSPSVVAITIDERIGGEFFPLSSGTGFVYDTDGHIITNNHVVEGADRVIVYFLDGSIVEAEVIGIDPDADIAVLQVDVDEDLLFPITFADSSKLVIGQRAVAIGSPFGQDWTMTTGIISALNRSITGLANFSTGGVIQTDTPINPGNSGGPLLNMRGELIGVNAQIISEERANSGVGFAIPSNLVKRVSDELIESGEVRYSYIGISGDDMNIDYIRNLNLPNNTRGVVVTLVRPNEPGERGGLLINDVIVSINGEQIINFSLLIGYLAANTLPGDTVTFTVLRDGEEMELNITLAER